MQTILIETKDATEYNLIAALLEKMKIRMKVLNLSDEEIAKWFTDEFSKKHEILFDTEVESVSYQDNTYSIKLKDSDKTPLSDHDAISLDFVPVKS